MRTNWLEIRFVVLASLLPWGCSGATTSAPNVPPPSRSGPESAPPDAAESDAAQSSDAPETVMSTGSANETETGPRPGNSTDADAGPAGSLAGNWKLSLSLSAHRLVAQPWLLEISGAEGSYTARVLETATSLEPAELKEFKTSGEQVRFRIVVQERSWSFDGLVAGDRIQGSLEQQGQLTLAWLERTSQKSLGGSLPGFPALRANEFKEAQETDDVRQRVKEMLEFIERHAESPLTFEAARTVLQLAKAAEMSEADVRDVVRKYEELAGPWGRRWSEGAIVNIAYDLTEADAHPALALEYAQKAKESLDDAAGETHKRSVERLLAIALVRADRTEEGKSLLDELIAADPDDSVLRYHAAVAGAKLGDLDRAIETLLSLWPHPMVSRELERVWKTKHGSLAGLDERLDQAYLVKHPPIPLEPYAGRTDASGNQTVLVELFTGVGCFPCVAAEVAFDGLARTFKPTDVVLLEYHTNLAGPDPLANAGTEARAEYYNVREYPSLLVNGQPAAPGGGLRRAGREKYAEYRAVVEQQLERNSAAKLDLSATRDGDTLTIDVKLGDVPDPGENLRLRFALIESVVRYTGNNGLRLHRAVVRALPGGADGLAVTESATTHQVTVDLAELKIMLERSPAELEKERESEFPSKPLELNRLAVAAFLQDDTTKSVVQAAFTSLESNTAAEPAPAATPGDR